jgi:hydroxylamine reductase
MATVGRQRASLSLSVVRAQQTDMACFQCEQTQNGEGCFDVGVCGKTPQTATLQDLLVDNVKGLSMYAHRARELGVEDPEVNDFTLSAMFSTLTNVNFDADRFASDFIPKAIELRDRMKGKYEAACAEKGVTPDDLSNTAAAYAPASFTKESLEADGRLVGLKAREDGMDENIFKMQELIVYGLKGACAYAHHAAVLGSTDPEVFAGVQKTLSHLGTGDQTGTDFNELVGLALGVGATNLSVLKMLDLAHNQMLGAPEPSPVNLRPKEGKAILISGHDLQDLKMLLEQTEGKGINVYTHGEMLPAHGYPELKKFSHLAGNYGGAWQLQKFEFPKFPGPIVMTTNCIIEPRKSYAQRIHTTDMVGWPGVDHVARNDDGTKDFSKVIDQALEMDGFTEKDVARSKEPEQTLTGFGHNAVLSVADQVLEAIQAGHLKHVFVIGGCDGSEGERNYFRDLALKSPSDSLILTLGCGKFRFNKHDFGTIPNTGLPRMLDMGQCNDSYSAVVVASTLADALGVELNDLPISYAISWFEQKAVAVFLTMVHLGIKDIHLGPNLPAFVSPKLAEILTGPAFGLRPCNVDDVEADLKQFLA